MPHSTLASPLNILYLNNYLARIERKMHYPFNLIWDTKLQYKSPKLLKIKIMLLQNFGEKTAHCVPSVSGRNSLYNESVVRSGATP